jgi:hypothetical protein
MPIRTNRGRAAVYRRLWGWPMRSPTHLVGTTILVVAIIVSAGLVLPSLPGGPGDAGAGSVAPSSRTPPSSRTTDTGEGSALPTRLSRPLSTPTRAAPAPQALRVARSWAAAWVRHPPGTTRERWLQGLKPYTTAEYLARMHSIDVANIPATQVTGAPTVARSYTSSVDVEIPTDGPMLAISVVRTDSGWRVAGYDQVG